MCRYLDRFDSQRPHKSVQYRVDGTLSQSGSASSLSSLLRLFHRTTFRQHLPFPHSTTLSHSCTNIFTIFSPALHCTSRQVLPSSTFRFPQIASAHVAVDFDSFLPCQGFRPSVSLFTNRRMTISNTFYLFNSLEATARLPQPKKRPRAAQHPSYCISSTPHP